jgi:phosphatidylglycerophosphate synthase
MAEIDIHADRDARPLRSLILLAVPAALAVAAAGFHLSGGREGAVVVSTALFLGIAVWIGHALATGYPHARLGLCNALTLMRGALASALAAPLLTPERIAADTGLAWTLLAIAVVGLALDGVDGWLARRSGLVSEIGARFDMEFDAILAVVLAALALASGKAGVWVLALGAMRYAFVLAAVALPWLRRDLLPSFRRKVVCVVQIAVLIAFLAPPLTAPASTALGIGATVLLCWSFAVDIVWLARRR